METLLETMMSTCRKVQDKSHCNHEDCKECYGTMKRGMGGDCHHNFVCDCNKCKSNNPTLNKTER